MKHHLIWWLNWALSTIISFFILCAFFLHFSAKSSLTQQLIPQPNFNLPSSFFSPKDQKFDQLGEAILDLKYLPPSMKVPDLRSLLIYHGRNARPDAKDSDSLFFTLGPLSETNQPFSIKSKEKIYLMSQNSLQVPFALSPGNRVTTLWFEAEPKGNEVMVYVRVKDELGQTMTQPLERSQFTLSEKSSPINQAKGFMIDQMKADPALLSRQKAKWSGTDKFLDDHGGEEFKEYQNSERIQFGEGEEAYTIYLGKEDVMIWKNGRWIVPNSDEATQSYPLAKITKLEGRLMVLELFDIGGRSKVNLNLLKLNDPIPPLQTISHDFQFIGARTKMHSMFKVNNKREIVGVHDWFLQEKEGWRKLKTAKEIDAYINGSLIGPLLVIDRMEKQNEEQWFSATIYSRARSTSGIVNLPLKVQSPGTPALSPSQPSQNMPFNQEREFKREPREPPEESLIRPLIDKNKILPSG